MKKKKVAIIGTNGIPARYGGFETLAEYITSELNDKYDFTVYCSNLYQKNERVKTYNNSKLVYYPFNANGFQSIIFDTLNCFHAWIRCDILLILGPAFGFILPLNLIFRKKIIVNHGGLNEWEREKLSYFQKKWVYWSHRIAAKSASFNISDNEPLAKSLESNFGIKSEIIAYGGDHIKINYDTNSLSSKYEFLKHKYDLSISRAQPDNNLHLLLEAYEETPSRNLVLISNWKISEYGKNLKAKYLNFFPNIYILDAIYDQSELNVIRSNTSLYIHSHSQCGTAPSLVEAMNYKIPIICFNVETNRATTQEKSKYFDDIDTLKTILNNLTIYELTQLRTNMDKIAKENYTWKIITNKYSNLFEANKN